MQNNWQNIFTSPAIAVTLLFTALVLANPVAANEIPNVPASDITYREPNFFTEGKKQFENEIQLLIRSNKKLTDNLLKISPDLKQIQQQISPLENPPVVRDDAHS